MTTKLQERIIRHIKDLAPEVKVEVVKEKRHTVVEVSRPGVEPRRMPIAGSPTSEEYTFRNAIKQAARLLQLEKQ